MTTFNRLRPIYKILILLAIALLLWWIIALIFQAIRRRSMFSDKALLSVPTPTLGAPLSIPDLPIFNHTYSNNLGNTNPAQFTCNLSLFNDFVGTNTLSIELKLPTKTISGLAGLTVFQCLKIEYTKTVNTQTDDYKIVDVNGAPDMPHPSCVESFGPYAQLTLNSIIYNKATTQESTFTVEFGGFGLNPNDKRTFILSAVQGSNTMGFVTKALTDYLSSSGILTTNIHLPSFTEAQINDNMYKTYTHTVGVLPGASCLTCTVTDSLFNLGAITNISFQDIEITDIILLNEDVVGSNIFNCTAVGSLNQLNDGGEVTVHTNGFGIDLKCHCGFDAGPLDIVNPYKEFDKTATNEWRCSNSTTKLSFQPGNLISINFKIDLGTLLLSSIDSVVFRENAIHKVNNTLKNCDAATSLIIDGADTVANLQKTDNFINKLLLSSANKLLEETLPNLLRDLLNQNVGTINGIIEEEKSKIL